MAEENITIYVTRPCRMNGEHTEPGAKFTVPASQANKLLATHRFSKEDPKKPATKAKAEAADK